MPVDFFLEPQKSLAASLEELYLDFHYANFLCFKKSETKCKTKGGNYLKKKEKKHLSCNFTRKHDTQGESFNSAIAEMGPQEIFRKYPACRQLT